MITEQDWKAQQAEKVKEREASRRVTYAEALLRQAEVDARLLTGHPAWDKYLSQVQVLMESAIKDRDINQDHYNRAFDEKSRNLAQVELHRCMAVIEVLKQVMSIPNQVVTHAVQAGPPTDLHA